MKKPEDNQDFNPDDLLKDLFKEPSRNLGAVGGLKDIFNARVRELNMSTTAVLDFLKIQSRTLNGILGGTQRTVDVTTLLKLADFLRISKEETIQLYISELEKNLSSENSSSAKTIDFIKENFDLVALKKAGFIRSITNFEEIQQSINNYFGLKSILDYKKPSVDVAFSAGLIKPRNDLTRSMWIQAASDMFRELNNPYDYDREALVKFFPEIRWYSKNVNRGLFGVIKGLFKLGVTVIYLAPLPSLHVRGATFSVNGKPCIVITDYRGFYPTIWFALIHELFHVLFDWDEIRDHQYHLSGSDEEQLTVVEKEKEANEFAREYLLSEEKLASVRPHLYDRSYVEKFAEVNHVHPSFVYVFNAYDSGGTSDWAKAKKVNPSIESLKKPLENPWQKPMPIPAFVNSIRNKYY